MIRTSLLTFLLLLFSSAAACGPPPMPTSPSSREAKLLVNAEKVRDPEVGFVTFWDEVEAIAAREGVEVEKLHKAFKFKERHIVFFDTEDFAIRSAGYSLRRRTKVKKGKLSKKHEYSLKFRSTELEISKAAEIQAPDYVAETELEEDLGFDPESDDGLKRVFSMRTKFKSREEPSETLGAYAELFPVLGTLEISPHTAVIPVNGVKIIQHASDIAKLDFGNGLVATATLTLWTNAAGDPLIAEFSFDHDIDDYANEDPEAKAKLEAFFKATREELGDWRAEGSSKTAFTYGAKGSGEVGE